MYDLLGSAKSGGRHRHLSRAEALEYAPHLRTTGLAGRPPVPRRDGGRRTLHARGRPHRAGARAGVALAVTRVRATGPIREGARWSAPPGGPADRGDVRGRARPRSSTRPASGARSRTGRSAGRPSRSCPSRGSHLIIPRDRIPARGGMTLRIPGRVAFMVPWPRHWVIGTTDKPYHGPVDRPSAQRRRGGRDPRDAERGDGPRPDAGRHRGHVRRAAAAGRAVGRELDGEDLAGAPGQRRGRGAGARQRRQVHDLPGDGPRRGGRGAGRRGRVPAQRHGRAADRRRRRARGPRRAGRPPRRRPTASARRRPARWWTATGPRPPASWSWRGPATSSARSSTGSRSSRPRWPGPSSRSWRCRWTTSSRDGSAWRRSCGIAAPAIAPRVAAIMGEILGWDEARQAAEVVTYLEGAHREFDVPPPA